jgi:hypothetical protein
MTADVLLNVCRFSIDLGFEPAHVAIDIHEFQTKFFAEPINALTHDETSSLRSLQEDDIRIDLR